MTITTESAQSGHAAPAGKISVRPTTALPYSDVQSALEAVAGASGAPSDAQYIVATADSGLSAERVVTDTATIAKDVATAAQLKLNVVDDSISDAKLRNSAAVSVIGRSANSAGDPADIAAGSNDTVFQRVSNALTWAGLTIGMFANNLVTLAKIAQGTALSVLGVTGNSTANYADIVAANDGEVLRRSGTSLGFGTVATAGIANDAVTYAKIQNVSATDKVLGRSTSGAGDVEEIACTAAGRAILDDADAAAQITTLGAVPTVGNKTMTGGIAATSIDDGTKTTGTFTPTFLGGNIRRYVNGGAHTLAPPTGEGTMIIQVTNDGSAGAITTSGFTKVSGDSLTTTSGHDFMFFIAVINGFSTLDVRALQ